jgi:hypothetical protein
MFTGNCIYYDLIVVASNVIVFDNEMLNSSQSEIIS